MKILHTSDWHIGQNFYRFDREDEHRHIFGQLAAYMRSERPDALVVSGDVFHNAAPSTSAQRLFIESVMGLHDASPETIIVITAGNHDSGSRLDAERELWSRLGIRVVGACRRRDDGTFDPAQCLVEVGGKGYILAAPHHHPSTYPPASTGADRENRQREFFSALLKLVAGKDLPTVLMAHLAVDGCNTRGHEDEPVGGMLKENLAELGDGYDYLALGHIHMPQTISARAYYCGSPLPVSFSEDYDHYANLVVIDSHGAAPKVTQLMLNPLRRVKTIPAEGAPLDEAIEALANLDDADDSYVRLLIDQDDILPADAEDRARLAAEGKACRFCEVRRKPRKAQAAQHLKLDVTELDDFTKIEPLKIAMTSYERKHHQPMSQTLIDLMNQAINLANAETL